MRLERELDGIDTSNIIETAAGRPKRGAAQAAVRWVLRKGQSVRAEGSVGQGSRREGQPRQLRGGLRRGNVAGQCCELKVVGQGSIGTAGMTGRERAAQARRQQQGRIRQVHGMIA